MSLRPIEHEHRLKSAAEAESFFRALHLLGQASVQVNGHHTKDPERFYRLVNAIEPKRDHTISFENGKMDLAALRRLSDKPFHYLDIATTKACYRSWPDRHTWVYPNKADTKTITFKDIPAAINELAGMTDDVLLRGFINGLQAETKPFLVDFLGSIEATVHVNLHIDIAAARALADPSESFDWGDELCTVDFPDGRIHGYLVTPKVGDEYQAKWKDRISKALERAKLL